MTQAAPPEPTVTKASRPSARRIALQLVAFAISVGLFALVVVMVLKPENRPKLEALVHAPARIIAGLIGLTVLSFALNATGFWVVLFPVRRINFVGMQATNSAAMLLSYLPFKASAIARFVIHNRRDGIPLITIMAWMAALLVTVLTGLAAPVAAAVLHPKLDLVFAAYLLAGLAVLYGLTLTVARTFAHARGLARLHAIAAALRAPILSRMMHHKWFHHMHAGFAMLSHPVTLAAAIAIRVADLWLFAARFMLGAAAMGSTLDMQTAVFAAVTYFIMGVVSPAGNVGAREGTTYGLAKLLAFPGVTPEGVATIALAVTGTEIAVSLVLGGLSLLYLRPDRLLGRTGVEVSSCQGSQGKDPV